MEKNNETIDDLAEDKKEYEPMPNAIKASFGGYFAFVSTGITQCVTNGVFGVDVPGGKYIIIGGVSLFFGGIAYNTVDKHVSPLLKERVSRLNNYFAKH